VINGIEHGEDPVTSHGDLHVNPAAAGEIRAPLKSESLNSHDRLANFVRVQAMLLI
jgi:hypothetical protein